MDRKSSEGYGNELSSIAMRLGIVTDDRMRDETHLPQSATIFLPSRRQLTAIKDLTPATFATDSSRLPPVRSDYIDCQLTPNTGHATAISPRFTWCLQTNCPQPRF